MLFFNFVCLLYLMVLTESYSISKNIAYDTLDDIVDSVHDLGERREYRPRHGHPYHNHRREQKATRTTRTFQEEKKVNKNIANLVRDTPVKKVKTEKLLQDGGKSRNGFWSKILGHKKTVTRYNNEYKRRAIHKMYRNRKNTHSSKESHFSNLNFNNYTPISKSPHRTRLDAQSEKRKREIATSSTAGPNTKERKVNRYFVPRVNGKPSIAKPYFTPARITELVSGTTELTRALTELTTQLAIRKQEYGINRMKSSSSTVANTTPKDKLVSYDSVTTPTAESNDFIGTAKIETLLNDIKLKAVQMVAAQSPAVTDIITNTVTETTFEVDPLLTHLSLGPQSYTLSTFISVDAGYNNRSIKNPYSTTNTNETVFETNTEPVQKIRERSITEDIYTMSHTLEDTLQKSLKKLINKMKCTISTQINKEMKELDSTIKKTLGTRVKPQHSPTAVTKPMTIRKITKTKHKGPFVRQNHAPKYDINNKCKIRATTTALADDYMMITLFEQILAKTHENNIMKMLTTTGSVVDGDGEFDLAKRNAEPTDNDDISQEDASTLDLDFTSKTYTNSTIDYGYSTEPDMTTDTSFEGLSNKICFNEYVNGYKHYLKFQRELENQNFSNLVKYQAHRHHSVNDIGKFILSKIPQLHTRRRRKRFFDEDVLDDQDISTKNDDSWFRKHFYISFDKETPKKFHTSQIVEFKSATPEGNTGRDTENALGTTEEFIEANLEALSESLTRQMSITPVGEQVTNQDNTSGKLNSPDSLFQNFGSLKLVDKLFGKRKTNKLNTNNKAVEKDRDKRNPKEHAVDNMNNIENSQMNNIKSTNVLYNNNGYVDVNLIPRPTAIVKLREDKQRNCKLHTFLNKFRFRKRKKHKEAKKHERTKRQYRVQRFNPFKKLREMLKAKVPLPSSKDNYEIPDYAMMTSHIDTFKPVKYNRVPTIDEIKLQIPNITQERQAIKSMFDAPESMRQNQKIVLFDLPFDVSAIPAEFETTPPGLAGDTMSGLAKGSEKPETSTKKFGSPESTQKKFTPVYNFEEANNAFNSFEYKHDTTTISYPRKYQPPSDFLGNQDSPDYSTPSPSVVTEDDIKSAIYNVQRKLTLPTTNSEKLTQMMSAPKSKNNVSNKKMYVPPHLQVHKPAKSESKKELNIQTQLTRIAKFPLPHFHHQKGTLYPDTLQIKPNNIRKRTILEPKSKFKQYLNNYVSLSQKYDSMSDDNEISKPDHTYKTFPDYFNDLLMWHGDLLNADRITVSQWENVFDIAKKNSELVTTMSKIDMQRELNHMNEFIGTDAVSNKPISVSVTEKLTPSPKKEKQTFNDVNIESKPNDYFKAVAINDNAIAKTDDVEIRGETKYFHFLKEPEFNPVRYNEVTNLFHNFNDEVIKPTRYNEIGIRETKPSEQFWKSDNENKKMKDEENFAFYLDTTLLAYDDGPDFLTEHPKQKKMSKTSIKLKTILPHTSPKPIAKTNPSPTQYFSTPLPMRNIDFDKFLKENQLDVQSVTMPLLSFPRLTSTSKDQTKSVPKLFEKEINSTSTPLNALNTSNKTKSLVNKVVDETAVILAVKNPKPGKMHTFVHEIVHTKNYNVDDDTRRKRYSEVLTDPITYEPATKAKNKVKKKIKFFDFQPSVEPPKAVPPNSNSSEGQVEVELTIMDLDDLDRNGKPVTKHKNLSSRQPPIPANFDGIVTEVAAVSQNTHNKLLYNRPQQKLDEKYAEQIYKYYPNNAYATDDTLLLCHPTFEQKLLRLHHPKRVRISSQNYKFDAIYNEPDQWNKKPVRNKNKKINIVKYTPRYKSDVYDQPHNKTGPTENIVFTSTKSQWNECIMKRLSSIALLELLNKFGLLKTLLGITDGVDKAVNASEVFSIAEDSNGRVTTRRLNRRCSRQVTLSPRRQVSKANIIESAIPSWREKRRLKLFSNIKHKLKTLMKKPQKATLVVPENSTIESHKTASSPVKEEHKAERERNIEIKDEGITAADIDIDIDKQFDKISAFGEDKKIHKEQKDNPQTKTGADNILDTEEFPDLNPSAASKDFLKTNKDSGDMTLKEKTPTTQITSTPISPLTPPSNEKTTECKTHLTNEEIYYDPLLAHKQKAQHTTPDSTWVESLLPDTTISSITTTTVQPKQTTKSSVNKFADTKSSDNKSSASNKPADRKCAGNKSSKTKYSAANFSETKLEKRELQSRESYTAKDVAALEVIVDLVKNPGIYEESDAVQVFSDSFYDHNVSTSVSTTFLPRVTPPTKTALSTNSIQVHIAIPYNLNMDRKRSLEPLRVRRVFAAKMLTPVDLEYQVRSFEDVKTSRYTPKSLPREHDAPPSGPQMYLLIDTNGTLARGNFSLQPLKGKIELSGVRSRQVDGPKIVTEKVETTSSGKNLAKVTLSKNFVAAVNKHLVQLYENLTAVNDSSFKHNIKVRETSNYQSMDEMTDKLKGYRRHINWDTIKKYFGHDRVCNCKCKPNKTICRACAASDAVISELMFEFKYLTQYMRDHCTEIQTFFRMNPSGGKKLRDSAHMVDKTLHDYYKRVRGKCKGRTCNTFSSCIDKRSIVRKKRMPKKYIGNPMIVDMQLLADDISTASHLNICFANRLLEVGETMLGTIGNCIGIEKRSVSKATVKNHAFEAPKTEKKKLVKNMYSLDNINVNIICKPESDEDRKSSTYTYSVGTATFAVNLAMNDISSPVTSNYDLEIRPKKHRFLQMLSNKKFRKIKDHTLSKYFTYYVTTKENSGELSAKLNQKREVSDQIESPDASGTIWNDYWKSTNILSTLYQNFRNEVVTKKTTLPYSKSADEKSSSTKGSNSLTTTKHNFKKNIVPRDVNATDYGSMNTLTENLNVLFNILRNLTDLKEVETISQRYLSDLESDVKKTDNMLEHVKESLSEHLHEHQTETTLEPTARVETTPETTTIKQHTDTETSILETVEDKLQMNTKCNYSHKPEKNTHVSTDATEQSSVASIASSKSDYPKKTTPRNHTNKEESSATAKLKKLKSSTSAKDAGKTESKKSEPTEKTTTGRNVTEKNVVTTKSNAETSTASSTENKVACDKATKKSTVAPTYEILSSADTAANFEATSKTPFFDKIKAATIGFLKKKVKSFKHNTATMPTEIRGTRWTATGPFIMSLILGNGTYMTNIKDKDSDKHTTKAIVGYPTILIINDQNTEMGTTVLNVNCNDARTETADDFDSNAETYKSSVLRSLLLSILNFEARRLNSEMKRYKKESQMDIYSWENYIDINSGIYNLLSSRPTTMYKSSVDMNYDIMWPLNKLQLPSPKGLEDEEKAAENKKKGNLLQKFASKFSMKVLSDPAAKKAAATTPRTTAQTTEKSTKTALTTTKARDQTTALSPTIQFVVVPSSGKTAGQTKPKHKPYLPICKVKINQINMPKSSTAISKIHKSTNKAATTRKTVVDKTNKVTDTTSKLNPKYSTMPHISQLTVSKMAKFKTTSKEVVDSKPVKRFCDISATFKHALELQKKLSKKDFEIYAATIKCFRYKKAPKSFIIKTKIKVSRKNLRKKFRNKGGGVGEPGNALKWNWIRSKRSLNIPEVSKESNENVNQIYRESNEKEDVMKYNNRFESFASGTRSLNERKHTAVLQEIDNTQPSNRKANQIYRKWNEKGEKIRPNNMNQYENNKIHKNIKDNTIDKRNTNFNILVKSIKTTDENAPFTNGNPEKLTNNYQNEHQYEEHENSDSAKAIHTATKAVKRGTSKRSLRSNDEIKTSITNDEDDEETLSIMFNNANFVIDENEYFEPFFKGEHGIYSSRRKRQMRTPKGVQQLAGVLRDPPFSSKLNESYAMLGDCVIIHCVMNGMPHAADQDMVKWMTNATGLLELDNVAVEGDRVLIKDVEAKNAGVYTCERGSSQKQMRLTVVTLPRYKVVVMPMYSLSQRCAYDDLKAMHSLGPLMENEIFSNDSYYSVEVEEPICMEDKVDKKTYIQINIALTLSPHEGVSCSTRCRRDLHNGLVLLASADAPVLASAGVVISRNGINKILKPAWPARGRRTFITHTLRRKGAAQPDPGYRVELEPGSVAVMPLCPAGYYLVSEQKICAACPVGSSSQAGENACVPSASERVSQQKSQWQRRRRCQWWWYPGCGYCAAWWGAAFGCAGVAALAHSRRPRADAAPRDERGGKGSAAAAARSRPLSPSRVILAKFFRGSRSCTQATESQETKFSLWKEQHSPPPLPPIDFDL